jgi:hypothetical protein
MSDVVLFLTLIIIAPFYLYVNNFLEFFRTKIEALFQGFSLSRYPKLLTTQKHHARGL